MARHPDTTNANDNSYGSDGDKLLVPLAADGSGGYTGTFVAKPEHGGIAIVTTYGFDDAAFADLERRWTEGYAR